MSKVGISAALIWTQQS
eukprot:jgi/Astpho2/8947/gw1.00133.190.1_t